MSLRAFDLTHRRPAPGRASRLLWDGGPCVLSPAAVRRGGLAGAGDRRQRPAGRYGRGLRGRRRPHQPATGQATRATSRPACSPALRTARTGSTGTGSNGLVDPADPPQSFIFRDAVDSASVPGDVAPDNERLRWRQQGDRHHATGATSTALAPMTRPTTATSWRVSRSPVAIRMRSWARSGSSTNGSMVVDFELNQKPFKVFAGAPGVAKPDRSINDILISLEYANGGSNPEVTLYRVSAVQNLSAGQVVTFSQISDATVANAVRSATNFDTLANVAFPSATYDVPAFAWAEASVNLAGLGLPVTCLNFGQGSIRSRTGGAPSDVAAQGRQPALPALDQHLRRRSPSRRSTRPATILPARPSRISPNPILGAPAGVNPDDHRRRRARPRRTRATATSTHRPLRAGGRVHGHRDDGLRRGTSRTRRSPTQDRLGGRDHPVRVREWRCGSLRWQKEDAAGRSCWAAPSSPSRPTRARAPGASPSWTTAPMTPMTPRASSPSAASLIGGPAYVIAERGPARTRDERDLRGHHRERTTWHPRSGSPFSAGTFVNTLGSIRWQKEDARAGTFSEAPRSPFTPNPLTGSGSPADRRGQRRERRPSRPSAGSASTTPAPAPTPSRRRLRRRATSWTRAPRTPRSPRRSAPAGCCRHLRQPPGEDPLAQVRAGRDRRCWAVRSSASAGPGDRHRLTERRRLRGPRARRGQGRDAGRVRVPERPRRGLFDRRDDRTRGLRPQCHPVDSQHHVAHGVAVHGERRQRDQPARHHLLGQERPQRDRPSRWCHLHDHPQPAHGQRHPHRRRRR